MQIALSKTFIVEEKSPRHALLTYNNAKWTYVPFPFHPKRASISPLKVTLLLGGCVWL